MGDSEEAHRSTRTCVILNKSIENTQEKAVAHIISRHSPFSPGKYLSLLNLIISRLSIE